MSDAWQLLTTDDALASQLATALRCSGPLAAILTQRGLTDPEAARRFLEPRLADLPNPFEMKDMEAAIERIWQAVKRNERIALYGDYDVDGVTSVSQLQLFLQALGANVDAFIPDRLQEGYGLNRTWLETAVRHGVRLIIALDCGISDGPIVALARQSDVDVIIVDHHQVPTEVPNAVAILNPRQTDCPYPCKSLAAAGISFQLLVGLRTTLRKRGFFDAAHPEPDLRRYTDLVALGTIADMVPLDGANRILARYGLDEMGRTDRPGIRALRKVAGIEDGALSSWQVAFQLGPRLNAAGRVANAADALMLLTVSDQDEAQTLALQLDQENRRRRTIEAQVLEQACAAVDDGSVGADSQALVLAGPDWHPGVVGIVAARMVQRYARPVFLLSVENGLARGSARGVEGFDVFAALQRCAPLLERYGGHRMAGGLTVRVEHIPTLREQLCAIAGEMLSAGVPRAPLLIDLDLPLAAVDEALAADLARLAPFGVGNREPSLLTRRVRVVQSQTVGQGHLRLRLDEARRGGRVHSAIAFGMAERKPEEGQWLDLVSAPQLETWRGRERLTLHVRDFRLVP